MSIKIDSNGTNGKFKIIKTTKIRNFETIFTFDLSLIKWETNANGSMNIAKTGVNNIPAQMIKYQICFTLSPLLRFWST